jgi:hypothetical protein
MVVPGGATPRALATSMEHAPRLSPGPGERFRGFGVTGVTFASGHVLALRHFPASSLGPGFTSIWHRSPTGDWTLYSDIDPALSCSRYFGADGVRVVQDDIALTWPGDYSLVVNVRHARIAWALQFADTAGTRAVTALLQGLPAALRRRRAVRAAIERTTARLLGSGRIALDGVAPSGHRFALDLQRCWTVSAAAAWLRGGHLGPVVLPRVQERLGELWISCWGILHFGDAQFLESAPPPLVGRR